MAIMTKLILALGIMTMVGCASSAAQQEAASQQPASKKPKLETPDDDSADARDADKSGGGTKDCKTSAAADELRDLAIGVNGADQSLCDTLLDSDHAAMVLYITSPTCVSCKETLAALNQKLQGRDDVAFMVAVPTSLDDFVDSYSAAEISTFVSSLAPAATPATDPAGKTWLALSADPTVPVFPLVITFNRSGKGYVLNADDIDSVSLIESNLFPKIDSLAK